MIGWLEVDTGAARLMRGPFKVTRPGLRRPWLRRALGSRRGPSLRGFSSAAAARPHTPFTEPSNCPGPSGRPRSCRPILPNSVSRMRHAPTIVSSLADFAKPDLSSIVREQRRGFGLAVSWRNPELRCV